MDYYDGNTVTGLWNYAQHYALKPAASAPWFRYKLTDPPHGSP
jgi:hypothetical protein